MNIARELSLARDQVVVFFFPKLSLRPIENKRMRTPTSAEITTSAYVPIYDSRKEKRAQATFTSDIPKFQDCDSRPRDERISPR